MKKEDKKPLPIKPAETVTIETVEEPTEEENIVGGRPDDRHPKT